MSEAQARLADGSLTGEWILDPRRSRISLKTRSMWGLVPVNGAFGQVAGSGTVSATGSVTGTVTVNSASLDTRNVRRDKHLSSADFLHAEEHPQITFAVQSAQPTEQGATISGELTVLDQTRPLSFDAAASIGSDGDIELDGQAQVNRADFGMTWNRLGVASMKNTLVIHAVLTRR